MVQTLALKHNCPHNEWRNYEFGKQPKDKICCDLEQL